MTDSPDVDKNIVDVTVYEINKETKFYAYTALWCGPCRRIKPKLIETMSKHGYKTIEVSTMQKVDFKKDVNEFVPFFVVKKYVACCDDKNREVYCEDFKKVDSIQTSDETLFRQFLSRNGIDSMVLDDNF